MAASNTDMDDDYYSGAFTAGANGRKSSTVLREVRRIYDLIHIWTHTHTHTHTVWSLSSLFNDRALMCAYSASMLCLYVCVFPYPYVSCCRTSICRSVWITLFVLKRKSFSSSISMMPRRPSNDMPQTSARLKRRARRLHGQRHRPRQVRVHRRHLQTA